QTATAVRTTPAPVSSSGPFWEARLSGLQPGTLYHYSIGGGPDHTFRTPPSAAESGFRVNVEGDIGDSSSYANMLPLQRLIAQDAPDLVLALGELTYAHV